MEPPVTVFQLNGHGSRIYKYWASSKLNSYNLSVVLLFLFWRASLWFIVVTREIVFVISVSFSLTRQAMYVFQFTGPWFCMNFSYLGWLTKRTLMWYTEINRSLVWTEERKAETDWQTTNVVSNSIIIIIIIIIQDRPLPTRPLSTPSRWHNRIIQRRRILLRWISGNKESSFQSVYY